MLHPKPPMEYVNVPGKNLFKGFFSTGSGLNDETIPYDSSNSSPSMFLCCLHIPTLPSAILQ
jgi:hypothetical protein